MAKGNDGNLLQHWIEAAVAEYLCQSTDEPLHIALTHGMRPFESFDVRGSGTAFKRLDRALKEASEPQLREDAPAVLRAYRDCGASSDHYPNSAELLAAVVGRDRLRGVITEVNDDRFTELADRWSESPVSVVHSSWRRKLDQLGWPTDLAGPWLFSMDPMTFLGDANPGDAEDDDSNVQGRDARATSDDCNLRPADLRLLEPIFRVYLASAYPGAVTIFCYSLRKSTGPYNYQLFKSEIEDLGRRLGCCFEFCEIALSNPHVGAVLSMDSSLIAAVTASWSECQ